MKSLLLIATISALLSSCARTNSANTGIHPSLLVRTLNGKNGGKNLDSNSKNNKIYKEIAGYVTERLDKTHAIEWLVVCASSWSSVAYILILDETSQKSRVIHFTHSNSTLNRIEDKQITIGSARTLIRNFNDALKSTGTKTPQINVTNEAPDITIFHQNAARLTVYQPTKMEMNQKSAPLTKFCDSLIDLF